MKKFLTIGGAMQDIFIQYPSPESLQLHTADKNVSYTILPAGKKIEVETVTYECGGGATNSAVSFSRLGFSVATIVKLGDDTTALFITEHLKKNQISTDFMCTTQDAPTGASFIIPEAHGNHTILAYRGANLTLTPSDIANDAIADADYVYITSLSGPAAHYSSYITACAKQQNKIVIANPGTTQLRAGPALLKDSLSHIDILILNHYEAQLLLPHLALPHLRSTVAVTPSSVRPEPVEGSLNTPTLLRKSLSSSETCFTLQQFFKTVHAHGPHIIIVTNGAEGVYASELHTQPHSQLQSHTIYFHPSIPTTMVSSTGAGDAFGSACTGYLAHGESLENGLRAGIINSSSVIQYRGSQTGLLTTNQIGEKMKSLNMQLLQKYDSAYALLFFILFAIFSADAMEKEQLTLPKNEIIMIIENQLHTEKNKALQAIQESYKISDETWQNYMQITEDTKKHFVQLNSCKEDPVTICDFHTRILLTPMDNIMTKIMKKYQMRCDLSSFINNTEGDPTHPNGPCVLYFHDWSYRINEHNALEAVEQTKQEKVIFTHKVTKLPLNQQKAIYYLTAFTLIKQHNIIVSMLSSLIARGIKASTGRKTSETLVQNSLPLQTLKQILDQESEICAAIDSYEAAECLLELRNMRTMICNASENAKHYDRLQIINNQWVPLQDFFYYDEDLFTRQTSEYLRKYERGNNTIEPTFTFTKAYFFCLASLLALLAVNSYF